MVKTICGTETDDPVVLDYEGKRYYFCEEECKDEFLGAPEKQKWLTGHQ